MAIDAEINSITSKFWLVVLGLAWVVEASAATPITERQDEVRETGDTLQFALPLTAFALTFLMERWSASGRLDFDGDELIHLNDSPRHDLALAIGRSVLITQALKFSVDEPRPNGGTHSFPSGHTSLAFTGAEFIRKEYGWRFGVPAYLLASYVGWSRVESHQHYTRDVLAGAAIGILVNHDLGEFHTRYGTLSLAPMMISNDYGVSSQSLSQEHGVMGLQFKLQF